MSGGLHLILVIILFMRLYRAESENLPYKATKLSYSPTEILYIEDGFPGKRTYKVEDFFWTGSGDGAPEYPEEPWGEGSKPATTVYKTKTVMSTVYISIMTVDQNTTAEPTTECTINCETATPDGEILPTPTLSESISTPVLPVTNTTDRQFWLLTIIRSNHSEPVVTVLEKQLANLYTVAFRRQQERHLGIARRTKRQSKPLPNGKPVNVHIYNISKLEDEQKVEVLYHVLVSGQPVAAVTAAHDMKLVTDEEVSSALGYPVLTKAEPYLRISKPQRLARVRDTWMFVGVVSAAILLLLITVISFTLCLKKKTPPPPRPSGITNRQRVFDREHNGQHVNEGYVEENGAGGKSYQSGKRHKKQPKSVDSTLSGQYTKGISISSPSSISSTSSSSSSSMVLTPKQPLSHRRRHKHSAITVKRPVAINKALVKEQSVMIESDSESSDRRSEAGLVKGRISPKSYLSMPSVKSFPRSSIPETLNRVLEPVSVLHLDMNDDVVLDQFHSSEFSVPPKPPPPPLVRHSSMGAEDPGVIGPVVWDMHCKRMQQEAGVDEVDDIKSINRMRRRFNDLLDDTFTLFGSGRESAEPEQGTSTQGARCVEPRGHSATNIRLLTETQSIIRRPKTSDSRRIAPSPGVDPPRHGAWGSGQPSPLVRPLSAGPFHRPDVPQPRVDTERILADSRLPENDPAVPLIAAIKTELHKCSLPGSTTNLAE